jgi:hypothetical protein
MNPYDTEKRGEEEGEVCNRHFTGGIECSHQKDRCTGIIALHEIEGCSCHTSPPCSACTEPREYCPECGWEASQEYKMNGYSIQVENGLYKRWERTPLDPTKISYHIESHTNASQKCVGVYPEGTTAEEVRKRCNGTFGGRFEHFGNGKFSFIAYTD